MTGAEVKYTLDLTGEQVNAISPMLSLSYIIIDKLEKRDIDISKNRYKFDTENELLYCYKVREYSGDIPSEWTEGKQYDIYNNVIYKYLFDLDSLESYVDIFDFSNMKIIALKESE